MSPPKLHYTDSQATGKPALIFIHGFPFSRRMWDEQAALCERTFRVITYDQRGHGQSELGNTHYMFELFVDDLLGLMDTLKVEIRNENEVWVAFQNFEAGRADKVPLA